MFFHDKIIIIVIIIVIIIFTRKIIIFTLNKLFLTMIVKNTPNR